jgi:hypothetical protein
MPRRPRIKLAGMPQYIVQCGINRELFFGLRGSATVHQPKMAKTISIQFG